MTDSTYIRNYAGKTTRLDNLCLGADNNSYRLYVNGSSHFTNGINIAGTAPISMFGVGSGTYNRSVIYCDKDGIILETPRASDSSDATILPLIINTRGGQKAPVYVGKLYVGTASSYGSSTVPVY